MVRKPQYEKSQRQGIWEGDPKKVAEARALYVEDPKANLVGLASALFSFRMLKRFRLELFARRAELIEYTEDYIRNPTTGHTIENQADKMDVISTIFEWMIGRRELPQDLVFYTPHRFAWKACKHGLQLARDLPEESHTRCLLRLTEAKLRLKDSRGSQTARQVMNSVERVVRLIPDPYQRARAYIKLGMLRREIGRLGNGFYWGIKGCFVPESTLFIRLKGGAALLGMEP